TPMTQRAPARLGWTRDKVTVPMTSAMRMAVQLLQGTRHTGRARRRPRAAQPQQLLELPERAAGRLHYEQVGPQPLDRPRRLGHAPARRPRAPRPLVGAAPRRAGARKETHPPPPRPARQPRGDPPRPRTRLAVAPRQFPRRGPVAAQRPQRRPEQRRRLAL